MLRRSACDSEALHLTPLLKQHSWPPPHYHRPSSGVLRTAFSPQQLYPSPAVSADHIQIKHQHRVCCQQTQTCFLPLLAESRLSKLIHCVLRPWLVEDVSPLWSRLLHVKMNLLLSPLIPNVLSWHLSAIILPHLIFLCYIMETVANRNLQTWPFQLWNTAAALCPAWNYCTECVS